MSQNDFCKALNTCMHEAEISNSSLACELHVSESLVGHWRKGTRTFRTIYLNGVCQIIKKNVCCMNPQMQYRILSSLKGKDLIGQDYTAYNSIPDEIEQYLMEAFYCKEIDLNAENKNSGIQDIDEAHPIQMEKRVVVFDFDGTLTIKGPLNSLWEELWEALGYSRDLCRHYHNEYDEQHITHQEWCDITCRYFQDRGFTSDLLDSLAGKITLLHNADALLKELRRRHIGIYIISGSIIRVIKTALGELNIYVDDIRANDMVFSTDGLLSCIAGTKYDFEGKAQYITDVLGSKRIVPQEVLFVGNSNNDEYVKNTGATTLCINPSFTNSHDRTKWDYVLEDCKDALDILEFLIR